MQYHVEILIHARALSTHVQSIRVDTPHGPDAAQAIAKARALEGMAFVEGLSVQAGNMEIEE